MARFCTQCGTPLAEGEICKCQQAKSQQMKYQQMGSQQNQYQQMGGQQNQYQQMGSQQNQYQQMGGQQNQYQQMGGQQNSYEPEQEEGTISISTEDWVPLRKLIGFGESNGGDVQGCFERGKKIVPELIAPCEQEVPVKQYHICNARSRLRGLWQEGRIQVTNKRVLFRLSGRSWIGKAMDHIEFTIDEVAGVSVSNGVRFGLWDFIVGALITSITMMIGAAIGSMPALLSYLLAIALTALFFVFKKKYFIKALALSGAMGMIMTSAMRIAWEHEFWSKVGIFMMIIILILYIVSLFLFALKPSLSIAVTTKCASAEPIYIWSRQTMVSVMEILPGEDADVAIEELGSMIMDIQKLGDFGIKKWKED